MLTGKEPALKIGDATLDKNGFLIPFAIDEWSFKGSLLTFPNTGQPKKLYLKYDKKTEIEIIITTSETLIHDDLSVIDVKEFEVIDLSE